MKGRVLKSIKNKIDEQFKELGVCDITNTDELECSDKDKLKYILNLQFKLIDSFTDGRFNDKRKN